MKSLDHMLGLMQRGRARYAAIKTPGRPSCGGAGMTTNRLYGRDAVDFALAAAAVADTIDWVDHGIRVDAPCFHGASHEAQSAAVAAVGGSPDPSPREFWHVPGVRKPCPADVAARLPVTVCAHADPTEEGREGLDPMGVAVADLLAVDEGLIYVDVPDPEVILAPSKYLAAFGPGYSPCGHEHDDWDAAEACAERMSREAIPNQDGSLIPFYAMTVDEWRDQGQC